MKEIEELLNKYFEGETTCEEERALRRFFTEEFVPEHLQMYRPIFAFFETEHTRYVQAPTNIRQENRQEKKKKKTFSYYLTYTLGTVAATLLLIVGVSGIYRHLFPAPTSYVIIDGKRYTDTELAREQAKAAFRDVSFSKEEVFVTLFQE